MLIDGYRARPPDTICIDQVNAVVDEVHLAENSVCRGVAAGPRRASDGNDCGENGRSRDGNRGADGTRNGPFPHPLYLGSYGVFSVQVVSWALVREKCQNLTSLAILRILSSFGRREDFVERMIGLKPTTSCLAIGIDGHSAIPEEALN